MNNIPEQFKHNKFCMIKSAISQEIADLVTQYALFDEIQDYHPDKEFVIGAHSKYADPLMESLLIKLHKTIEDSTGLTLIPTYSFFRVYRPGDELTRHVDRPSCEISSTVCFNYSYDDSSYSWPIFMNGEKLTLHPGDLAVYKGCDVEHWREKFSAGAGSWHVQGFFHYIDANGPFTDFKYDRRENIGDLPKLMYSPGKQQSMIDNMPDQITKPVSGKSYISFIK
jgi:hypothetical protein